MNQNETENGSLPINFQCKTTSRAVNYGQLLSEIPFPGCVLHKLTSKSKEGKFMPRGEYAILPMELFLKLLESYEDTRSKMAEICQTKQKK